MRLNLLLTLLCPTLLCLQAGVAIAANIYVDNVTGDDRRNGLEPKSYGVGNGPVRTITKALRLANKGDRIVLTNNPGQPYRESIAISGGFHCGIATFPFELIGNGATLDGSLSLLEAEWEFVSGNLFRVRPPRGAHQRLFLNGQQVEFVPSTGEARAVLKPLQWTLLAGQIYFCCEQGKIPQSYDLSCCGLRTGITIYQVDDVLISDLTVRGFQLDGVNAHDMAYKTKLLGVVSTDNGRSGFTVGGASRVTLDQCTGAGNGNSQLRVEGFSQATIRDCELDEKSAPALIRDGGRVFVIQAN
jgi:hypothetical protein